MRNKIIKLNSEDDIKKFDKKIWLYRSFLYKRTHFVLDDNCKDADYINIIEALNIKSRIKRITYVYDTACNQIDDYNQKNHICCNFKNGQCDGHRGTKHYNGCCRVCMYQSTSGCKTKNLSCKLYFCGYMCNRNNVLTFDDVKILKCLSKKCQVIASANFFSSRKSFLVSLYSGSFMVLTIIDIIKMILIAQIFLKNKLLAIKK